MLNLLVPLSVSANPLIGNSLSTSPQIVFGFSLDEVENIFQGLIDNAEEILEQDKEETPEDAPIIRRDDRIPQLDDIEFTVRKILIG